MIEEMKNSDRQELKRIIDLYNISYFFICPDCGDKRFSSTSLSEFNLLMCLNCGWVFNEEEEA